MLNIFVREFENLNNHVQNRLNLENSRDYSVDLVSALVNINNSQTQTDTIEHLNASDNSESISESKPTETPEATNDQNIINSETMMEILTNPKKLDAYLEKIKKEQEQVLHADKLRRTDYFNTQIFQVKIMYNLLPPESTMRSSLKSYMVWLINNLNQILES